MTDVAINPTGLLETRIGQRLQPTYLVSIEQGKSTKFFVATKLDDGAHYTKLVGFYIEAGVEDIVANYQELIAKADPSAFMEVLIPYSRVISIRSLTYRHKKQ